MTNLQIKTAITIMKNFSALGLLFSRRE